MTVQTELSERVDVPTPRSQPWDLDILCAADWQELRKIRLQALADSPHAFVAAYAEEAQPPEEHWRDRIESSTWMVARDDGETIGLARLSTPNDEPPETVRYIESVWVEPDHRCRGVVRSMVEELEWLASTDGVSRLRLWVLDTNPAAWDAYLKLGFSPELSVEDVKETTKTTSTGQLVIERRMVKDILGSRAGYFSRRFPTDGVPVVQPKELLQGGHRIGNDTNALRRTLPPVEV
jgi:ribosomal protein S18 acetylase RimI-like enzyme